MTDIKTIRDKIAALTFQKQVIDAQPRSRDEVEMLLAETLAQFEATAAANMARTVAQLAAGHPASLLTLTGMTPHGPVTIELGPMFTSLLGTSSMLKAMQAALKSVPEGHAPKAKAKLLAGLVYDLDALYSDEEKIIRESEANGTPIQRRADVLPQYVLAT